MCLFIRLDQALAVLFLFSAAVLPAAGCRPGAGSSPASIQTQVASPVGGQVSQGFADVPIYPGASRDESEEIDFGIEPIVSPGSFGQTEWRYYTSDDDKGKLSEFYQGEMVNTKYGWKQVAWGNIGENVSWGIYAKGNGDPAAWVVLNRTDKGTKFALVRGAGKLSQ